MWPGFDSRQPDMIKIIFLFILVVILGVLLAGWHRTYKIQHSSTQGVFQLGTAPDPLPEGSYRGSVSGYHVAWQGKSFYSREASGTNNFKTADGSIVQKYPFRTYIASGLQDRAITVLKIDYNISKNPWWLRMVLDEIVQTEPGHYVGKIHVRLPLGISFAVGYFTLEK